MRLVSAAFFSLLVASTLFSGKATAEASYSVLYTFGTNPDDGFLPNGGLVFDKAGNLYGTTQKGGSSPICTPGCGTVFELTPGQGGAWTESIIYSFCSEVNCTDGAYPLAGLVIDDLGNLYGTTKAGGNGVSCGGCGIVFELSPPKAPGGAWTKTDLWDFGSSGAHDAANPAARLTWDGAGNLYGTTYFGGNGGLGTVFELSPTQGGGWSEKVLYSFCLTGPPKCADGFEPMAAVAFDKSGNLYGTTFAGGAHLSQGTLYKLSPGNGTWTETTLYSFTERGGGHPLAAVNFDNAGNFYTTASQSIDNNGAVFKFIPQQGGGGKKLSFPFTDPQGPATPVAGVFIDPRFNNRLYGTPENGGPSRQGVVYGLVGKTLTTIHAFCCSDGAYPTGSLTFHAGNVYSTTSAGGAFNQGVVFEIKP
ncbi:MAG: choice-of-anchor tandem repeat GloVer-containing protein [Terriglobales bacterium]